MAEPVERYWRLEAYRNKLRHSLAARFLLRFHVALILAVTILAGWLADRLLLEVMHVETILLRYPLSIFAAYFVFYAGIAAWLRYSGIGQYLDARGASELAGEEVPVPPMRMGSSADASDWAGLANLPMDPEGCLWIVGVAVVFFGLGGYLLFTAPSMFADVVLEVLLAAGLLRGVRRAEKHGWMKGVWANTWGSLAFALVVAFFIGLFAQAQVPPATTLHQLWTTMRHPGR